MIFCCVENIGCYCGHVVITVYVSVLWYVVCICILYGRDYWTCKDDTVLCGKHWLLRIYLSPSQFQKYFVLKMSTKVLSWLHEQHCWNSFWKFTPNKSHVTHYHSDQHYIISKYSHYHWVELIILFGLCTPTHWARRQKLRLSYWTHTNINLWLLLLYSILLFNKFLLQL